MRSASSGRSSTATNPPTTSEWPPRYFVVECTTTSAPSSSGCCRYGVANVLSTTTRAPRSCASVATAAMSTIGEQRVGRRLDPHDAWCSSCHAAASASRSVRSATSHSTPGRRVHLGDEPERAAVGVVGEHARGRRARAARSTASSAAMPLANAKPVRRALERREARLERGARRVAAARVLVARRARPTASCANVEAR